MKQLILNLALIQLLVFSSTASAGTFQDYGIQFEYPDVYQISIEKQKEDIRVKLKKQASVISIRIKPTRIDGAFAETIAEAVLNALKKTYEVGEEIGKQEKKLPLKVKGELEEIEVDSLKYTYTLTHQKNDMQIVLYQTLYLFSYGSAGYIIEFTRTTEDFSDMVHVLSTFQFDSKEQAIVREEESRY